MLWLIEHIVALAMIATPRDNRKGAFLSIIHSALVLLLRYGSQTRQTSNDLLQSSHDPRASAMLILV